MLNFPLYKTARQFTSNMSKMPGWLLLSIVVIVVIKNNYIHLEIGEDNIYQDAFIVFVVWILYQFGDAIDKEIFPRNGSGWNILISNSLEQKKVEISTKLDMTSGYYKLSNSLFKIHKKAPKLIMISNELAKFARSMIVPSIVYGSYILISQRSFKGLFFVILSIVLLCLYARLKSYHMEKLYEFTIINSDHHDFDRIEIEETSKEKKTKFKIIMCYWGGAFYHSYKISSRQIEEAKNA